MSKYNLKLIKRLNNIIDVAREFGHVVHKGRMRCIRPNKHKNGDEHPSLVLYADSNQYYCPVCRAKGDVIDFVVEDRGLRFYDAVRYLADRSDVEPDSPRMAPTGSRASEHRSSTADEFLEIYAYFYELCSEPTEDAFRYLETRGISRETATEAGVKYILKQRQLLEKLYEKFTKEVLVSSGLTSSTGQPFWRRHKLIWAFFRNGKPVYFQGRSIDESTRPKEMCLAAPVPCPYNTDVLSGKPKRLFLCEGVVDTLTLLERKIPAVGIVGVNGFKKDWLELFRAVKVSVAFDSDMAGQAKAAELVQGFKQTGIEAEKIYLPKGYDVNSFFSTGRQFGI
jgi:DNA primase